MNDDDVYGVGEPVQATGTAAQLTETHSWGDHALDEYEEELARKKPLGFAPWPIDEVAEEPKAEPPPYPRRGDWPR